MADLTQERLKELFYYDPETGFFFNKTKRAHRLKINSVAGCRNFYGHLVVTIDSKRYYLHRLVYLYVYGYFPKKHIDHIDGNKMNNRINNLREVTVTENLQNKRAAQSNNFSGYLGVSFDLRFNKYFSRIQIKGRQKWLGYFKTAEEAHNAYLVAKRKYHPACTI